MAGEKIQIVVSVPEEHLDAVLEAIASAGGGIVGNYTHCSFTIGGTGRFKPNDAANPAVGDRQVINTVEECRIETIVERDRAQAVVTALRAAHPYEEPLIYLLPLLSEDDL